MSKFSFGPNHEVACPYCGGTNLAERVEPQPELGIDQLVFTCVFCGYDTVVGVVKTRPVTSDVLRANATYGRTAGSMQTLAAKALDGIRLNREIKTIHRAEGMSEPVYEFTDGTFQGG